MSRCRFCMEIEYPGPCSCASTVLLAESKILREALGFYADRSNYFTPDDADDELDESHLLLETDPGGRARAALAATTVIEEEQD